MLVLSGLAAAGCEQVEASGDWVSRYPWPIVDGIRETGERPVVMIYNDRGAGCTATVIAPRVALTAKHCVQGMSAAGWHVLVGGSMYSVVEEYGATETRTTPGSSLDNLDIAVMLLDRDFAHGFKRWEFLPWPGVRAGALITAIGYGQTNPDDPYSAGTKYRRNGNIVTLTGDREFITNGENTCQGDSGGPILFEDVVVGIVSRGEEGCTGMGIMTRVSGFPDLVNQALADTGACVPTQFEVCNRVDDDCWNGPDDAVGPLCACSDGAAPAGPEACNGRDDDCNAAIDDLPNCACTGGAAPGAETCNGIDDDCNGVVDDPCRRLGESCGADTECGSGMCVDLGAGRVCTANCTASGAAPCPDGGYCDAPACGTGMCRPAGDGGGAPLGTACVNGGECASRFCAALPGGGAVCARPCTPGTLSCFAGEVCLGLVDACGACVEPGAAPPPRGFGEPCAVDTDCWSGLCFTDGDPAACGADCAYRYCAEWCGAAGECPDGSHCRDGVCVRGPRSDVGESCVSDLDCVAGICLPTPSGAFHCVEGCTPEGGCNPGFTCFDGSCWPDALRPGDACTTWDDYCEGGRCLELAGRLVCVSDCVDSGDCESGLSCVSAGDGMGICVPPSVAGGGGGGGDDGCDCAVPGRTGGSALPLGLLFGALLLGRRLTRRRRSG
jgi:V8-like Glu-specific endopeptidase